ncbi:MAG: hypothetical protein OXF98_13595 [Rhodospirillaceae bacterium]|nr:hypothetical protein [Rhodospirillaceae bacterium]
MLVPHLTTITTGAVYVEQATSAGLEWMAANVGLRPIEGGRFTLRPFPTVTARRLATEKDGLRLVPWPRAYADLRIIGVRGEESRRKGARSHRHHYGERPEFVVLGGLVPEPLCSCGARTHVTRQRALQSRNTPIRTARERLA